MVLQKLAGNMGIGLHVGQYSYVRFFGVLVLESCVCNKCTNCNLYLVVFYKNNNN